MFGDVFRRKASTPVAPLVRRIIAPGLKGNEYTRFGLAQEASTIDEYILHMADKGHNVVVRKSGLVVCATYPFLAASPDGVVVGHTKACPAATGLLEVKNVLKNKRISFQEAA